MVSYSLALYGVDWETLFIVRAKALALSGTEGMVYNKAHDLGHNINA